MALHPGERGVCNKHGEYDEYCGECTNDKQVMEMEMKEVESKLQVEEVKLSTEDGLTFRTMEAEFYKDQIALQNAQQAAQEKLRGLNDFVATMHTKYGKDQKVSYIDPKTFVFTDRVAPGK